MSTALPVKSEDTIRGIYFQRQLIVEQVATSLPAYLVIAVGEEKEISRVSFYASMSAIVSGGGGSPCLPGVDSLVLAAIDALQQEFSIDQDRYYVSGRSFGGYGTWH